MNAAESEPVGEDTFDMPIQAYAVQSDYLKDIDGNTDTERFKNVFDKYLSPDNK